jgi:hypothetical protein
MFAGSNKIMRSDGSYLNQTYLVYLRPTTYNGGTEEGFLRHQMDQEDVQRKLEVRFWV